MTVGERIKSHRKAKGLNQLELANIVGISAMALSYYEQGKRGLKRETIEKIAKALEVPFNTLWLEDVPESEKKKFKITIYIEEL